MSKHENGEYLFWEMGAFLLSNLLRVEWSGARNGPEEQYYIKANKQK